MNDFVDIVEALAWPAAAVAVVGLILWRIEKIAAAWPHDPTVRRRVKEIGAEAGPFKGSLKIDHEKVDPAALGEAIEGPDLVVDDRPPSA